MSKKLKDDRQRIAQLEGNNQRLQQQLAELQQRYNQQSQELQQTRNDLERQQQGLSDSERLLRLAIDHLPQAVFWKDRNSVYLGCNQYFATIAGLDSPREIMGKTDRDLPWKPEEAEFFLECDRRVMTSDTPELGIIEPQQQADGSQHWLETNKIPLHDDLGKVIGILGTFADVSDRIATDKQLKQQAIAIADAKDGIGISTQEGFIYINQAHVQMFGYDSPEELLGKTWEILYDPDEIERFGSEVFPLLQQNLSWQGEATAKRKDGSNFTQELSLNVTEEGAFICICRDITQRKQAELARQQLNEELERRVAERTQELRQEISDRKHAEEELLLFKRAVESSSDAIAVADPQGNLIYQNPAHIRLYACETVEEYRERGGIIACYPDFRVCEEMIHTVLNGQSWLGETEQIARNDRRFPAIIRANGIKDESGNLVGLLGIITDISQQKQTELKLQEQEAFLRTVYDGVANPIFVVDVSETQGFRYLDCNTACERVTRTKREEIVGKTPQEWMGEVAGAEICDRFEQCIKNGEPLTVEECLQLGGQTTWWQTTFTPLQGLDGRIYRIIGTTVNISKIKQAEIQIIEQEQMLRTIYDGVPHPIFVVDVEENGEFRYRSYNRTAEAVTGLTNAEIAGKTPSEIFAPEETAGITQDFQRAVEAGQSYAYEECRDFPDREMWFFTTINPLKDPSGRIYRLVGTSLDISDRKTAEQALQESEAFNRYLFDEFPIGLALCRMDGKLLKINSAYAEIIGRTIPETLELTYWEITPEKYSDHEAEQLQSLETTGRYGPYEKEYIHKDNHLVPVVLSGLIVKKDGESLIWSSVADVSARKAAEERLRHSEERFRGLVETLNDWIWECDSQGFYTYVSPQVETITGYTAAEIIGKTLFDLMPVPEAQRLTPIFRERIEAGAALEQIENTILHKDGHPVILETSGVPIFDAAGNLLGYRGIDRDISERIHLERDRQHQNQALRSIVEGTASQTGEAFFRACVKSLSFALEVRYVLIAEIEQSETANFANVLAFWTGTDFGENFRYDLSETPCSNVFKTRTTCRYFDSIQTLFPNDPYLAPIQAESYVGIPVLDTRGNVLGLIAVLDTAPMERDLEIQSSILEIFAARAGAEIERMQAEQTVREKDVLLQTALEAGKLGCWRWHRQTHEIDWSDGVESILGLQPGALGGTFEDYIALIHPDDRDKVVQAIAQTLETERDYNNEHRIVLPGGQIQWIRATGEIWRHDTGEAIGLLGSILNDTQRKMAEIALIESAEQIHQQALQEQLLNQIANQIRTSLDLDRILNTTVREIQNFLNVDRCHFAWYVRDAREAYWNVIAEVQNPDLPSLVGQHHAANFGALSELLLRQQILRLDDTSTVQDSALRDVLTALGNQSMLVLPVRSEGGNFGIIACIHHQGVRPWRDDEVEFLEAVVAQVAIAINQADLLAQSQARAEELEDLLTKLQQTQTQLIQSEKMSSLGQMVAGVAHEINNPVNFIHGNIVHADGYMGDILGLLDLYQEHYPQPHPDIEDEIEAIDLDFLKTDLQKLFQSMRVGTDRIQGIVKSLRTFSRLDEAEVKDVDLHEGIDSTLMILQTRLRAQDWRPEIQTIKEYGELPRVQCHAGQLNQVFMNILGNAIDALEERDRQRTRSQMQENPSQIHIQTQQKGDNIIIRISDNGLGMSEATRAKLFDPFFTTKGVGKGTGLGLSISYQIVTEKHNGKLACTSQPGKTTFIIEIPCYQ